MPSVFQGLAQDITLQKVLDALGPGLIYEIDSISVGAATAGSVVLSFTWNNLLWTTSSIAFNASATTVQTAVQGAQGPAGQDLPPSSVIASGGPLASSAITLSFQNQLVGGITGQTMTPTGLTGGTTSFTRTQPGTVSGTIDALASTLNTQGGTNNTGGNVLQVGVLGSDNKVWPLAAIGGGSPAALSIPIFTPALGGFGSGAPSSAFHVAFKNASGNLAAPNLDTSGALNLQSAGASGSAAPAKVLVTGGADSSGNLRTFATDTSGNIGIQSSGTPGIAVPSRSMQVAGVDGSGLLRTVSVTAGGAVAIQDSSAVPEAPLSINGTAFTLGQAGAPTAALSVGTSSTLLLPDSTGGSSINGLRGQVEIVNVGNVDVCVSPSLATIWGVVWLIRPGGSLITTYSGPVSAITTNTSGGVSVGSPSSLVSVMEWA